MGRTIFFIFLTIIIAFVMVPNMLLVNNYNEKVMVKNNLNLASRVLISSIDKRPIKMGELGQGYEKEVSYDIHIHRDRLLNQFYDILYKNLLDKLLYEETKKNIKAKIIVYNDRFYICDTLERWSVPYYFIHKYGNSPLYLNTKTNIAYYYDDTGAKIYDDIYNIGLNSEKKKEIIITKLNNEIAKYTSNEFKESIGIKIYNPHKADGKYKAENSYFNVLDGLTFFVVYVERDIVNVFDNEIKGLNYQVAGYTLEDYR